MNLAEVLDLENDPAFFEVACPTTGILAWPAIRNEFLRLVIGDHLYLTAPLTDLSPHHDLGPIALGAARAALYNVRHPPQRADVLFVGTGAGLVPRDGRSFNRYIDHFVGALPKRTWAVESLHGGAWPQLPRSNERMGFLADRRVVRELQGRATVRSRHRELIGTLIDLAASRARNKLGWALGDERRSALASVGARRLATYPSEAAYVRRLLGRVRPRLAVVEEGSYGRMAVFNATARELGVTVAEFQHGMVTRGHDAYNVSPSLGNGAAYALTQPDVFLSYGEWWNQQFNAPIDERIAIGNPHREEVLRTWHAVRIRPDVMVIGDGVETDAYLKLCAALAAAVGADVRIVFRPHPRERDRIPSSCEGFEFDAEPDLYRSLASALAVVGEASTVLFEGVGIVPRVLVWDTPKSRFYLGDHPFERFETPAGAAALLEQRPHQPDPRGVQAFWAEGWRARFLEFIASHT